MEGPGSCHGCRPLVPLRSGHHVRQAAGGGALRPGAAGGHQASGVPRQPAAGCLSPGPGCGRPPRPGGGGSWRGFLFCCLLHFPIFSNICGFFFAFWNIPPPPLLLAATVNYLHVWRKCGHRTRHRHGSHDADTNNGLANFLWFAVQQTFLYPVGWN